MSRSISGRRRRPKDVLRDLAIAAVFWPSWEGIARLVHALLGPSHAKTLDVLLPRSPGEIALWMLVALSAGFCEELVFRGYLQQQLLALTGSGVLAVIGQAIVFAIGHAYQGMKQVTVIVLFGLAFGLLARWRRSVRPGMLAHAWADVFGGLFAGR